MWFVDMERSGAGRYAGCVANMGAILIACGLVMVGVWQARFDRPVEGRRAEVVKRVVVEEEPMGAVVASARHDR